MRPVDQTTFGFPGGNCFSACVASILELPLDTVPYFMEPPDTWWERFIAWCRSYHVEPIYFAEYPPPAYLHMSTVRRHFVMGGQSPRRPDDPEALHAVVAFDTEIVHDPHPSRAGLLTRLDCIFLQDRIGAGLQPVRIPRVLRERHTPTND